MSKKKKIIKSAQIELVRQVGEGFGPKWTFTDKMVRPLDRKYNFFLDPNEFINLLFYFLNGV